MAASFIKIAHDTLDLVVGATVPIQAVLRNNVGDAYASGVIFDAPVMYLHDPNWTIVASGVSLHDQGAGGIFTYDWQSAVTDQRGWYTAVVTWEDTTNHRVAHRLFRLADHLE